MISAVPITSLRSDGDGLPLLQGDGYAILQAAGPDLRTLQVLQNADRTPEFCQPPCAAAE